MGFDFQMDSSNLIAALETAEAKAQQAAAAALQLQAELVMTKAKMLTPVAVRETYPLLSDKQYKERYKPGELRASGHVSPVVIEGNEVTVELGFGNDSAGYALIVHEMTQYHHPNGQAKFLETPINESAQAILDGIAQAWAESM